MNLSPFTLDGAETLRTVLHTPGPVPLVIETTPAAFEIMLGGLYQAKSVEADKIALKLRISHAPVARQWGGTVIRFFIGEDDAEGYLRLVATNGLNKGIRQDLKTRLDYRADDREAEAQ